MSRKMDYSEANENELKELLRLAEAHGSTVAGSLLVRFDRQHAINLLSELHPYGVPDAPQERARKTDSWISDLVYACEHIHQPETEFCSTCFVEWGKKFKGPITKGDLLENPGYQIRVMKCGHLFTYPPYFNQEPVLIDPDDWTIDLCKKCDAEGIRMEIDIYRDEDLMTVLGWFQMKRIKKDQEAANG